MAVSDTLSRDIFDQVNDLIFIVEPGSGRILDANRRVCEFLGLIEPGGERALAANRCAREALGCPCEELLSLTVAELGPPEEAETARHALRDAIEKGNILFERHLRRHDGTLVPCEVNARRATLNGRDVIVSVVRDITERKQVEDQLQERERRLSTLISNLPGAVFRVRNDPNYTAEYVSDQITALTGYPADDFRENRRNFGELMHPDDRDRIWNQTQNALGEHRPYEVTYRFIDAHGREKWNWERGKGVFDANGELQAVEGFVQDITERKQAEAALREREEVLRLFVEHSPAAIGMFDNEMRYLAVSRRWLTDYGLGDRDIIGHSHYEIFPEIPQRWKDIHRRCLDGATERCDEDPFVRADGHTDWVKWEVRPWRKADGGIGGIIIFSELITARKQAELKITEYAERLERLSRQLLVAQEDERRRMARELHDELGQMLTAIKINLLSRARLKGRSPDELDAETIQLVEDALQQVRGLALALRPSMLDDLGLGPALRWMADQQAERGGFIVQVGALLPEVRLAPELETACFRIAQEALTNVMRHAQAKRVAIELHHEGDALVMTVQDDGRGFDVAAVRARANAGGSVGVLGMQERAALLGGRLEIESAPGGGTTLRARLPWRTAGAGA